MKTKIKVFLAILFFVLGIIFFVYPQITDKVYKNNVKKEEEKYIEIMNDVHNNTEQGTVGSNMSTSVNDYHFDELYELLDNRNKSIFSSKQEEFLYHTNYEVNDIDLKKYGLENQIFGFLTIPSIGITLPIYFGASNYNMRLGAVHLTGTSYPIGGMNTNSVIAAHRGYYRTKMFRDIERISIGDVLTIRNFNGLLTYKAVKKDIIDPKDLEKLTIIDGKDMVTIISCHPFPYNYQRYVVYFERVS